jgi:hypothetical protein
MKTVSEEVMDMIFLSKWSSQTLCAGAELGIFDYLSRDDTRTANDVAIETGLDRALLYRLLRALSSLSLLKESPGRHFNLTEHGAVLRTDAPGSLRYMAMLEGGPEHWAIWSHVTAMVRDGRQNALMREYGEMAFAHARANPDGYGAIFGRAMSGFSVIQSALALDALRNYDFSSIGTWCDVAGGHGHMMCSFLAAYPHLSGTVLDLPEVLAEKEQFWASRLGLEERCRYVAADMFAEVPCAADVYSLKMILHDWNESECKDPASDPPSGKSGQPHLHHRAHRARSVRVSFLEALRHPYDVLGQRPGAHRGRIYFASERFRLALRRLPLPVTRQNGHCRRCGRVGTR